jgi:hypothetical protein
LGRNNCNLVWDFCLHDQSAPDFSNFNFSSSMAGVASADISTGNVAMKSEHQDDKTEPAFQATGRNFIVGTIGDTDQLRMTDKLQSLLGVDLMNEARRAGIFVESNLPTVPAPFRSGIAVDVRKDDVVPTGLEILLTGISSKMPRRGATAGGPFPITATTMKASEKLACHHEPH